MGINLCAQVNRNNFRSLSMDAAMEDMHYEIRPEVFSHPTPVNDNRYDIDIKETPVGIKAAHQTAQLKQWESSPYARVVGVKSEPLLPLKPPRLNKPWGQKSLAEKLQERRENPHSYNDFVEGEREAKMYMNKIEDNSMAQLTETIQSVESLLEKETDIQRELKRQGEVVKQANRDARAAEKDIDDTSHRLKGMRSLGGKMANLIFRNPHHNVNSAPACESNHDSENNFLRISAQPMVSLPSYSPTKSKQECISQGVEQLCSLLDVVEIKQLDIGKELEKQHETMEILDQNMDQLEDKIGQQTDLMKSMKK